MQQLPPLAPRNHGGTTSETTGYSNKSPMNNQTQTTTDMDSRKQQVDRNKADEANINHSKTQSYRN